MKHLVLLHGWGVRPSVFDKFRAALAGQYQVCALALPGYEGVATCAPYDLASLADRIAGAAPDRCFVAGWSLGGQVALAWAERAPGQVERIALISTTPCFVQREQWKSAMAPGVLQEFASALEADVSGTLARFSLLQAKGDSQSRSVIAALRGALASPATTEGQALRAGLGVLLGSDLRTRLKHIRQPALVVHGEHDALVPPAAAKYLASNLPRGTLEVVRGSGHAPFLASLEAVARSLHEFLA